MEDGAPGAGPDDSYTEDRVEKGSDGAEASERVENTHGEDSAGEETENSSEDRGSENDAAEPGGEQEQQAEETMGSSREEKEAEVRKVELEIQRREEAETELQKVLIEVEKRERAWAQERERQEAVHAQIAEAWKQRENDLLSDKAQLLKTSVLDRDTIQNLREKLSSKDDQLQKNELELQRREKKWSQERGRQELMHTQEAESWKHREHELLNEKAELVKACTLKKQAIDNLVEHLSIKESELQKAKAEIEKREEGWTRERERQEAVNREETEDWKRREREILSEKAELLRDAENDKQTVQNLRQELAAREFELQKTETGLQRREEAWAREREHQLALNAEQLESWRQREHQLLEEKAELLDVIDRHNHVIHKLREELGVKEAEILRCELELQKREEERECHYIKVVEAWKETERDIANDKAQLLKAAECDKHVIESLHKKLQKFELELQRREDAWLQEAETRNQRELELTKLLESTRCEASDAIEAAQGAVRELQSSLIRKLPKEMWDSVEDLLASTKKGDMVKVHASHLEEVDQYVCGLKARLEQLEKAVVDTESTRPTREAELDLVKLHLDESLLHVEKEMLKVTSDRRLRLSAGAEENRPLSGKRSSLEKCLLNLPSQPGPSTSPLSCVHKDINDVWIHREAPTPSRKPKKWVVDSAWIEQVRKEHAFLTEQLVLERERTAALGKVGAEKQWMEAMMLRALEQKTECELKLSELQKQLFQERDA